jgi:nicotinate-nucleotide adenylyltransferase
MKLGLFGGSFDPIHAGHVRPVEEARRRLGLEQVVYLPTAVPPHKPERRFAPPLQRFAMVELALLAEAGLVASTHELTLGRPAYTVETLEHFRRERPGADLHLLLGGDAFADLDHWRRWREIAALARLVVLVRPGWGREEILPRLGAELRALAGGERVVWLENAPVEVSSTALRALLARGEEPPAGTVSPLVVQYVQKYRLYR